LPSVSPQLVRLVASEGWLEGDRGSKERLESSTDGVNELGFFVGILLGEVEGMFEGDLVGSFVGVKSRRGYLCQVHTVAHIFRNTSKVGRSVANIATDVRSLAFSHPDGVTNVVLPSIHTARCGRLDANEIFRD